MLRSLSWKLCCFAMVALSILAFTPLVIPPSQYAPMLGGIPLTLWAGVLIAISLVGLTLVGSLVHPDRNASDGER